MYNKYGASATAAEFGGESGGDGDGVVLETNWKDPGLLCHEVVITPDGPKSKPWFDRECYLTKKALKSQLKIYIRSNSEGDRKAYTLLKKKYSSLLTDKKKTYYIEIQERLKEVRDSAGFWKTISLFKNRRTTLGNISIQKWQQFYTELLTTSPPVKYDLSIRVILMPDDELMAEISLSEITGEIARLKRNKACGLDNIPNEAIKALPPAYLTALKDIFNRVLKTGHFPTTWCKTIIHPIFKNAGFRKEHSCQDHIFTLVSLIQLTLRRKRRKFYAFFINLKKAFDTVPQALLWKKLLDIGLNFRFINLIKNYYENMTAALKSYIRSNSEGDRKAYALLKKKYSSLLTSKKKIYYIKIQERLKEVRDSAGFWKTISLFKNRRTTLGNISIQKWQQFYTELLATSPPVKYDLAIRITGEIAHLKRNKACGLDNIPNEATKALPPAYLTALKDIYNRVLKTGQFPTTWCKTIIHPIFKNAGFRKEHSCQDHIFTIVSLIQLTLRRKRRKFYAFFIDLKKAFDTVPQALLWKKLLGIGLNFRFLNLIKNYYENMTAA
ncbi:hypothetical protein LAZ67_8000194, partial [Cordylochernes scorpioides]